MNTFLIAFKFSTISSMRIGLYNVKINTCVPNPMSKIRTWVKASVKGNLNVLSAHGKTTTAAIVITIQGAQIVANLTWLHRKIVIISCKKKRSKKLNQKKISFPEACKNHMSVSLNVFSIQLKQCLPGLKTRKNQLG